MGTACPSPSTLVTREESHCQTCITSGSQLDARDRTSHLEAGHVPWHQQIELARKRDTKAHVENVSNSVGIFLFFCLDLRQTANSRELDQILLR